MASKPKEPTYAEVFARLGNHAVRDARGAIWLVWRWALSDEPKVRELRWKAEQWSHRFDLPGKEWDGSEVPVRKVGSLPGWSTYRADNVRLELGVREGASAREEDVVFFDFPAPRTKKQVRYKDGEWQVLTRKGWEHA